MKRRLVVAAIAGLAIVAALPGAASAHPLGNFTTNHYIGVTVSADMIDVDIVIDVAEIPSIELLARLDTNADGTLDDAEADGARRSQCAERLPEIDVRVDSRPLDLELWAAGVQQRPGAGGLATIRIVCEARAANRTTAPLTLEIVDGGSPGALGWREIVVRGDGFETDPADADVDVAARLTAYPSDLLSQPLAERSATVVLRPGGPALARDPVPDAQPLGDSGGAPSGEGAATVPGGVATELPFLPDLGSLSIGTGLIGLLVAAVAGAGHALSPGHGKTVMAAYLVGTRGRARHAVLLGAAVTASHTLGVLALGGVVLFASDILPAERLYPILGLLSGAAVILIGAWLLVGCLRRLRAEASHARAHEHGHPHGHDHAHGHEHPHDHAACMPGLRGLLAIGIAGGLVPSTAALVLLLAAVAAGQAAYGLALALAFGAGMAAVLTGIGLAIVQGRQRLGPRLAGWGKGARVPSRLAAAAPWAIAVVVLVGGVVLTGQALAQTL
jgi:ABC-type nickel/cobalt efflux system permease component RcnA